MSRKILGGAVDISKLMNNFFIYGVFLLLFLISFMNVSFWSNFIVFICIFCIHTVSGAYILKDFFGNSEFTKNLSDQTPVTLTNPKGSMQMIFIIVFVIIFIFKIVSITMIIAVFDYGRKQIPNNDYNTYAIPKRYDDLINNYKNSYKHTTALFLLFAYLIITPSLDQETQYAIINVLCICISIALLGMTINEIVKANEFLKIKQRKQDLYAIHPDTKQITQTSYHP